MNRKSASLIFLGVCIILAILLLTHSVSSTTSGIIFAIALVLFGVISKGFRADTKSK
jgi:hypothetical protein